MATYRTKLLPMLVLLLGACLSNQEKKVQNPPSDPGALHKEAVEGVNDGALRDLLSRHWEWQMKRSPLWATHLGDHRYDDQIGDNSKAAYEAGRTQLKAFLSEAKGIPQNKLSPTDHTTLTLFIESLEADVASEVCAFEEWSISHSDNPVSEWNYLPELHTVKTPEDGKKLIARYRQIPRWIDNQIEHLRRGASQGKFANAESTRRAIQMLEDQLSEPFSDWPLLKPTKEEHSDWPSAERDAFRRELEDTVKNQIQPAFARYLDFVKSEILPHAREEKESGLWALPGGEACYQAKVREYTTLSRTAKEIHELGLREIDQINEEMRDLGEKLFGTRDLATIIKKLREDPALFFQSPEEIEKSAETALAAARARIGDFFGLLPQADCVVSIIPAYEAPFTTTAYYRPPTPDGTKPGEYFINVYQPETRPRFEAEVLAFHESIPGHHLQIAIAQELPALPAFRKYMGMTAFVEGWALYTERLAEEMGLYSGDLERMGMLSYDAWRAARLVVDTGIHALGWSREEAVQYMLAHTALSEQNIRNEVDRYIVWPGQALAYKSGQMEIWRLRRIAEKELGERFDIKGFHDAVLGGGAVSLPVLEEQVKAWIAKEQKEAGL